MLEQTSLVSGVETHIAQHNFSSYLCPFSLRPCSNPRRLDQAVSPTPQSDSASNTHSSPFAVTIVLSHTAGLTFDAVQFDCSMTRYILEKDIPLHSAPGADPIVRWKIRARENQQEVATLTRSGEMFLAESDTLRASAESADPFLALRTVLRTDDLWIEDGVLRKVEPEDFEK
jgi:hypothetical protein